MTHTRLSASRYPCPQGCVRSPGHDLVPCRDGTVRRWHLGHEVTVTLGAERWCAQLEAFETVDRDGRVTRDAMHPVLFDPHCDAAGAVTAGA